jgi:aspartate--ammonia ligase
MLIIPKDYAPTLTLRETEEAIKEIKFKFQEELKERLNLYRVSAPLFVDPTSGLNDNLNGTEDPVSFEIDDMGTKAEIVHSLAKWKRMALHRYEFKPGEGIYTDMNAIRKCEELDNTHSIYVDQWDWEKVISKEERTEKTLKETVKGIYEALKSTEKYVEAIHPSIKSILPEDITFITTQELEDMYPGKTDKERENLIVEKHKAVFLMQIGDILESGSKHDGRAPDYDDWSLNGDILVWHPVLEKAYELSSMGIRVDKETMLSQLKKANAENRKDFPFHKGIIEEVLPLTIGGGIGQSRICMYMLKKAHIGEVQASIWPEKMIKTCEENKIKIL